MTRPMLRLISTFLLVCSLGGAAYAFAQADDQDNQSSGPGLPAYQQPPTPVTTPDAAQRAAFSVLGAPATTRDKLPPAAATIIAAKLRREWGANADLARQAQRSGDYGTYLLPGRQVVCLVDSDGVAACNGTDAARGGQLALVTQLPDGTRRVVGAVPDGVTTVAVTDDAGAVAADVTQNSYIARTKSAVTGASYWLEGRQYHVAISSP
jgi:hypothetical protein